MVAVADTHCRSGVQRYFGRGNFIYFVLFGFCVIGARIGLFCVSIVLAGAAIVIRKQCCALKDEIT